jgi:hypothetical protein
MERHLSWPDDIAPLQPFEAGANDGATISTKTAGQITATSLYEVDKRRYGARVYLEQESSRVEEWRAFLRHLRVRMNPFWIAEPKPQNANGYYGQEILVGWGDATQTCYHFPFYGTPAGSLLVDGALVAQTNHGVANQLTDAQASPATGLTGLAVHNVSATLVASRLKAYHGQESGYVDPGGALTNYGIRTTAKTAASAGDELTAIAWVSGELTAVKIRLWWYDSGDLSLGSDDSAASTATAAGWTGLSVTATAPANTAYAEVYVYQTTSSSAPFWVDCIGRCPATYSDWWLPSEAPQVIECTAAPGDTAKVTASTTEVARAMIKCHLTARSWRRAADAVGNERYTSLDMEESLP